MIEILKNTRSYKLVTDVYQLLDYMVLRNYKTYWYTNCAVKGYVTLHFELPIPHKATYTRLRCHLTDDEYAKLTLAIIEYELENRKDDIVYAC